MVIRFWPSVSLNCYIPSTNLTIIYIYLISSHSINTDVNTFLTLDLCTLISLVHIVSTDVTTSLVLCLYTFISMSLITASTIRITALVICDLPPQLKSIEPDILALVPLPLPGLQRTAILHIMFSNLSIRLTLYPQIQQPFPTPAYFHFVLFTIYSHS